MSEVATPRFRHIDVDLYYRMGEKGIAQEIAWGLRPLEYTLTTDDFSDEDLKKVRNKLKQCMGEV